MKGRGGGTVLGTGRLVAVEAGRWGWRRPPRPAQSRPTACSTLSISTAAAAASSYLHHGSHNRLLLEEEEEEEREEESESPHSFAFPLHYDSELEARIEKVIYGCRFMAFLAIAGSLMGSILCFLKGCVYVMDSFMEYFFTASVGGGKIILMLMEAIDMYLIGTVMFVFGTGLYELFISNMDIAKSSSYGSNFLGLFRLLERPKWLEIQSVNDLKTKLGHVIVMVLLVGLFEKSKKVTISSCTDLSCFAASVLLSSGCLYLLSMLNTPKGGRHA